MPATWRWCAPGWSRRASCSAVPRPRSSRTRRPARRLQLLPPAQPDRGTAAAAGRARRPAECRPGARGGARALVRGARCGPWRGAGQPRAGDPAAQPAGLCLVPAVPVMRRRGRMPELQHRAHGASRAGGPALPLLRSSRGDAVRPARSAAARCRWRRGVGTQQLERLVAERFPAARVAPDGPRHHGGKGGHQRILAAVDSGDVDILLGTQMIAKGLDFPHVTLVGVINADTALHLPDFRAAERTFQLLAQVAGRAGRGPRGGRVIVQTRSPGASCPRPSPRRTTPTGSPPRSSSSAARRPIRRS